MRGSFIYIYIIFFYVVVNQERLEYNSNGLSTTVFLGIPICTQSCDFNWYSIDCFVPNIMYYRKKWSYDTWCVSSAKLLFDCNILISLIIIRLNICSSTELDGTVGQRRTYNCFFTFCLHWSKLKSNFRRSLPRCRFKRVYYV